MSLQYRALALFLMAFTAGILGVVFNFYILPKDIHPKVIGMNKQVQGVETQNTLNNIMKSHNLNTVKSNQWYSSVLFSFPSEPLFAHPIAYKISNDGLSFSYPTVRSTQSTIFASFDEDFVVGFNSSMEKPNVKSIGDWNIILEQKGRKGEIASYALTKGVPFTTLFVNEKDLILKSKYELSLFPENSDKEGFSGQSLDSVVIEVNGHLYALFLPERKPIELVGKKQFVIKNATQVFIGLLNDRSSYQEFKTIKNIQILGTNVSFETHEDTAKTIYSITTNEGVPLLTLYPHHTRFLTDKKDSLGFYATLRGGLDLVKTNNFSTLIPLNIPPDHFTAVADRDEIVKQVIEDINEVLRAKPPTSKNYFLGVWYGKIANLLLLADAYNLAPEKQKLMDFILPKFKESLLYFEYNPDKTSIIATKPEFGNEDLNDHHFQYSYLLYLASVLSRFDKETVKEVEQPITDIALDIANTDRESERFPFLRTFDVYEGHSWADGDGKAADGNNQESTSEAIFAWYSLYLWGKTVGDQNIQNTALFLYTSEIESAFEYWFNRGGVYKAPYSHAIASLVWGGKADFETFFSTETNMKYGIQLLPFSPASEYLGRLENFKPYDADIIKNNGGYTKEWADLLLMWKSFYSPSEAIKQARRVTKIQDGNTRSLMLHTIQSNVEQ